MHEWGRARYGARATLHSEPVVKQDITDYTGVYEVSDLGYWITIHPATLFGSVPFRDECALVGGEQVLPGHEPDQALAIIRLDHRERIHVPVPQTA